jgi:large subunit ribosomal protein L10
MSNNKAKKKVVIDNTLERFKDAGGIIITDYQGLTAGQINELRRSLEKSGADYKVIKNTLTKKALETLNLNGDLKKLFKGVTGIVFCKDYMSAIKALTTFAKANEKLKIKGGYIDSKEVTVDEIKALSVLPSKQELIAKFVILLNSPIQRLINVLDRAGKATVKEAVAEVKAEVKEEAKTEAPAQETAPVQAAEIKTEN